VVAKYIRKVDPSLRIDLSNKVGRDADRFTQGIATGALMAYGNLMEHYITDEESRRICTQAKVEAERIMKRKYSK